MFCKNCGTAINEGSRFCPKCGWDSTGAGNAQQSNAQQSNAQQSNYQQVNAQSAAQYSADGVYMPPANKKSKTPILAAVGVLAVIAVVLAVLFTRSNPLARTIKAAANLKGMKGADISASLDAGYDNFDVDLSFKLGKDTEHSLMELEGRMDGDTVRVAFADGDLGMTEDGEYYGFYKDFLDEVEDELNGSLEELGIKVDINKLVKNGKLNEKYIKELAEDAKPEDYDEDMVEGMAKMINDFIFKECNKSKVWKSFIDDYEKSGGKYSYSVDVAKLGLAFIDYIEDCKDSGNKKVKEAAKFLEENVFDDNLKEVKSALREGKGEIVIDVEYSTKGGRLASLEMSYDEGKVSLEIENYNKPDIDEDDIKDFLDECEDGQDDYDYYDDYWDY